MNSWFNVPVSQMLIFILFVSPSVLFEGVFSLWVSLKKSLFERKGSFSHKYYVLVYHHVSTTLTYIFFLFLLWTRCIQVIPCIWFHDLRHKLKRKSCALTQSPKFQGSSYLQVFYIISALQISKVLQLYRLKPRKPLDEL